MITKDKKTVHGKPGSSIFHSIPRKPALASLFYHHMENYQ
jgi:hypothetical protein